MTRNCCKFVFSQGGFGFWKQSKAWSIWGQPAGKTVWGLKKTSNNISKTTEGWNLFSWHAHKLNMKYGRFPQSGTLKMCAATKALEEATLDEYLDSEVIFQRSLSHFTAMGSSCLGREIDMFILFLTIKHFWRCWSSDPRFLHQRTHHIPWGS